MSFQKKEVCPFHEDCEMLQNEREIKDQAIDELAEVEHYLNCIGFAVDTLVDSMERLLPEAHESLYRTLKILDPEFPWEDPYCDSGVVVVQDDEEDDSQPEEDVKKTHYEMFRDGLLDVFKKLKEVSVQRAVLV